jgi:hypothetical protein
MLPLVSRLIQNPDALDQLTVTKTEELFNWIGTELINEKVLSVENWLEVGFHLCKQRWDSSIEWLEKQPMSKILAMLSILEDFAEKQEKAMKDSSKRK